MVLVCAGPDVPAAETFAVRPLHPQPSGQLGPAAGGRGASRQVSHQGGATVDIFFNANFTAKCASFGCNIMSQEVKCHC
jgi:hypothetical protein